MEIVVDWKQIETEEDFYDMFLPQVKAPEWHGRNLDALTDSVVTGDINSIEPPYIIRNINTASAPESIIEFQLKVLTTFNEGVVENRGFKIVTQ